MDFLQVNLGNLLTILTFLLGGTGFAYTIKSEVRHQADKLASIEGELVELRKVLISMARYEERLNAMDQRMLMQGQRIDSQGERILTVGKHVLENMRTSG